MGGEIKELKLSQIGNKEYEEVGIVYNIKEGGPARPQPRNL